MERFQHLFAVLEDLIKRVADTEDPEIRRKRAHVRAKLVALERDPTPISDCWRAARAVASDYRHTPNELRAAQPWEQPALAALTGAAVALTLLTDS